jgi:uncharacterized protein Yka (UPF0111/DUF47 family)
MAVDVWMGWLSDIFDAGEHKLFVRSRTVVRHAQTANSLLKSVISGRKVDISDLKKIEEASDAEVFELVSSITSGGVAPNLMDDLLQFVKLEDDIVDNLFNLGRALNRFRPGSASVNRYIREQLSEANKQADKALRLLYEMHTASDIVTVRRLRREIEQIEQASDDVKDGMIEYAYKSKLDYKSFYHIIEIAHLSDDILDACEDAADAYTSIMLSILT